MRYAIRSSFVLFFSGFFTLATAQLPPEILADRHLIQAEQLRAEGDHAGALLVMKEIISMQREHNFKLADEFHFKYARVAMSADSIKIALDAASKYLSTAGRTGEFYKEALALSLNASEELDVPEIKPAETCTGKTVGSSCWMALSSHPDCYVWNPYLQKDATATWSGRCSGGVGRGEGTISWTYTPNKKSTYTETGRLKKGRHHGKWVRRFPDGTVQEGPYVRGRKDGLWVERVAKAYRPYIARIPYSAGKRHGTFEAEINACPDSSRVHPFAFTIRGEFVKGKKQGRWENERKRGMGYASGRYKDGSKQGHWIFRYSICADVKGDSRSRLKDYAKGEYLDGKRHGRWILGINSGSRDEGTYSYGKKHGEWVESDSEGKRSRGPMWKGKSTAIGLRVITTAVTDGVHTLREIAMEYGTIGTTMNANAGRVNTVWALKSVSEGREKKNV